MKIKICGLFRKEDIDYINEGRPDYAGFVFAESRRQVLPEQAAKLRKNLSPDIVPVGVFVNAPVAEIAALHRDGIIEIAQLHGSEDEDYIKDLQNSCGIRIIKTITLGETKSYLLPLSSYLLPNYYLLDSGAGSGKTFNWDLLEAHQFTKPWFLAGGINLGNIEKAMALKPYAIDVSSGAETEGIKDREKILKLTLQVKREEI